MLKYGKNISFHPEKLDPFNIDRQSIELIPNGSTVLDIGCATGFMGEYLIKEKKCVVDGIEVGREEARKARKVLREVIEGDIEGWEILKKIHKTYDVVFSSALIEHLKDPWTALKNWKRFLKRDGMLIITTSNIAHWSMRLKLLRGRFEYGEYGILDNTHLRFFTYHTFQELVRECGYGIESVKIDSVGGGYPRISKFLSRYFPNLFAYQILIQAKSK